MKLYCWYDKNSSYFNNENSDQELSNNKVQNNKSCQGTQNNNLDHLVKHPETAAH